MTYIQNALAKRGDEDEGFTLIELLVVVIIIGILAAIAIPVFLNQREKAWDSATKSDIRNAQTAFETHFTDNGSYMTDAATPASIVAPATELSDAGFSSSDGVVLDSCSTTNGYVISGQHSSYGGADAGGWFVVDSNVGTIEGPYDTQAAAAGDTEAVLATSCDVTG